MEPPKEQKPIPLDYATPSPWVEWRVIKRIKLGVGLAVLWFLLTGLCTVVIQAAYGHLPALAVRVIHCPFVWLDPPLRNRSPSAWVVIANCLFWGIAIAFLVHRRWRKRGGSSSPDDRTVT